MEEIVYALELKSQLDALRPISKDEEQRIMQKFRLDWNYHSNNLEGNSLTYGETKALILFNITAQGKPLKDHFEITGHNEAINWVIDLVNGDRPLTESFIRELHTLLLKESYETDAITPDGKPTKKRINIGSYKSTPNHVQTKTGEIFRFATPEETPSKMADLMDWYNNKSSEDNPNPILIAAEFHYRFIRIHPFDDGNGRTARILMNFILMKFGYPPVIIKTEDKANYFAALQLADAGNIQAFINYIAKNLVHSLQIMIAGAQGKNIEEPDDIDKEIALLEKRLDIIKEKASLDNSRYDINFLFDTTMPKLINKILEKGDKLLKLYFSHDINYVLNEIGLLRIVDLKSFVGNRAKKFTLEIRFNKFTLVGFDEFEYICLLYFELFDTYYTISDKDKNVLLNKLYGSEVLTSELDYIAISEVKRHKEFIEQKISEKENEL